MSASPWPSACGALCLARRRVTPTEVWLPIGAAAFYLYDSAALLWQNELVYLRAGRRWLVEGGSELRLRGRRVFLPNPLLPQRPQFLVCWSKVESAAIQAAADIPDDLLNALRPIGALNVFHVLLLCALPVALWTNGTGLLALLIFALFYIATFLALAIVWRRRAPLGLTRRKFWLLTLDVLACAPFAVNMTRKLAAGHAFGGEPLRFAARHFDDTGLARVRGLVEARLREEYAAPEFAGRGQQVLTAVLPRLSR
ncbi:MAG TPA: hypothetical protein VMK82_01240 [Steroidobacteraceae bacterium]|nr:hypothetical protein [Steroidobacteraceae bacterium]